MVWIVPFVFISKLALAVEVVTSVVEDANPFEIYDSCRAVGRKYRNSEMTDHQLLSLFFGALCSRDRPNNEKDQ